MFFNKTDEPHNTWLGAIVSAFIYVLIIYLSVLKLEDMFSFGNDSIQINSTESIYEDIGVINMTRIGKNIPFYNINLGDPEYLKNCQGNCSEYLSKHFNFTWEQTNLNKTTETISH